ncbi:MAG TPA: hypothetical protein VNL12_04535 [Iamia sp.]|nr:hypothetical protein [Iamia sp.]HXH56551.1 hypothetical protein [Iamia sp.]
MREVKPGIWKLTATAATNGDRKTRRVHKTVRARTRREAAEALAAFVSDLRSAAPVAEPKVYAMTVDEAIETFLVEHLLTEKGREERTVDDYRRLHAKWFAAEIGHRLVRDVDEAMLDDAFGKMRTAELLMANAGPGPAMATSAAATGASAIWEITAADQIAELAPTTSSSGTSVGRTLAAAGLKKTLKADSANAAR